MLKLSLDEFSKQLGEIVKSGSDKLRIKKLKNDAIRSGLSIPAITEIMQVHLSQMAPKKSQVSPKLRAKLIQSISNPEKIQKTFQEHIFSGVSPESFSELCKEVIPKKKGAEELVSHLTQIYSSMYEEYSRVSPKWSLQILAKYKMIPSSSFREILDRYNLSATEEAFLLQKICDAAIFISNENEFNRSLIVSGDLTRVERFIKIPKFTIPFIIFDIDGNRVEVSKELSVEEIEHFDIQVSNKRGMQYREAVHEVDLVSPFIKHFNWDSKDVQKKIIEEAIKRIDQQDSKNMILLTSDGSVEGLVDNRVHVHIGYLYLEDRVFYVSAQLSEKNYESLCKFDSEIEKSEIVRYKNEKFETQNEVGKKTFLTEEYFQCWVSAKIDRIKTYRYNKKGVLGYEYQSFTIAQEQLKKIKKYAFHLLSNCSLQELPGVMAKLRLRDHLQEKLSLGQLQAAILPPFKSYLQKCIDSFKAGYPLPAPEEDSERFKKAARALIVNPKSVNTTKIAKDLEQEAVSYEDRYRFGEIEGILREKGINTVDLKRISIKFEEMLFKRFVQVERNLELKSNLKPTNKLVKSYTRRARDGNVDEKDYEDVVMMTWLNLASFKGDLRELHPLIAYPIGQMMTSYPNLDVEFIVDLILTPFVEKGRIDLEKKQELTESVLSLCQLFKAGAKEAELKCNIKKAEQQEADLKAAKLVKQHVQEPKKFKKKKRPNKNRRRKQKNASKGQTTAKNTQQEIMEARKLHEARVDVKKVAITVTEALGANNLNTSAPLQTRNNFTEVKKRSIEVKKPVDIQQPKAKAGRQKSKPIKKKPITIQKRKPKQTGSTSNVYREIMKELNLPVNRAGGGETELLEESPKVSSQPNQKTSTNNSSSEEKCPKVSSEASPLKPAATPQKIRKVSLEKLSLAEHQMDETIEEYMMQYRAEVIEKQTPFEEYMAITVSYLRDVLWVEESVISNFTQKAKARYSGIMQDQPEYFQPTMEAYQMTPMTMMPIHAHLQFILSQMITVEESQIIYDPRVLMFGVSEYTHWIYSQITSSDKAVVRDLAIMQFRAYKEMQVQQEIARRASAM